MPHHYEVSKKCSTACYIGTVPVSHVYKQSDTFDQFEAQACISFPQVFDLPPSILPALPKHTQLQKRVLATHVATTMFSYFKKPPKAPVSPAVMVEFVAGAGEGTQPGLTLRMTPAPPTPTAVDSTNPVIVPSTRYQSAGLARARVKAACNEDAQGRRLCGQIFSHSPAEKPNWSSVLTIAKAIPMNAPIPRTGKLQLALDSFGSSSS